MEETIFVASQTSIESDDSYGLFSEGSVVETAPAVATPSSSALVELLTIEDLLLGVPKVGQVEQGDQVEGDQSQGCLEATRRGGGRRADGADEDEDDEAVHAQQDEEDSQDQRYGCPLACTKKKGAFEGIPFDPAERVKSRRSH